MTLPRCLQIDLLPRVTLIFYLWPPDQWPLKLIYRVLPENHLYISFGKCIYIALIFVVGLHARRSGNGMDHLKLHQCLPLPPERLPDGAIPDWGCGHLIAAYYSFNYPKRMKGWVGLVGWPTEDCLPVSCRSSTGQGKFAGLRPTFYSTVSCNQECAVLSHNNCHGQSEVVTFQVLVCMVQPCGTT